ncbi:hypothetical protein FAUST_405 [Fusarium austroamericanum]|uniref:Malic acid transport protein n=1 Tax=Fusarium austroamericanum TaxID=282268 RepID=A0AAN6HKJ7_FUSAU|nr:hypothetical protein FAUST_405 [Fusarium austroamericanum]
MAPSGYPVVAGLPSPASASASGLTTGYESPSEEHPPFFTAAAPAAHDGKINQNPRRLAVPRPALTQRPSYIAAIAFEDANGNNQSRPRLVNQSSTITAHSLNHVMATVEKTPQSRKIGLRDRIACYQWTYFTLTMSTGGIANIIHSCRHAFFQIQGNLTDPHYVAVILINTCQYGIPHTGPWLLNAMEWVFWVYAALSVSVSAFLYLILWSTLIFPVHTMTPTWVFPAYPLLLNAPFAANLIAAAESSGHKMTVNTVAMALGATAIQGTGCLIAFMISSAFIYRLMTQKLPRDNQRPGIFMSIGPYGFTAAGIAQLGSQADLLVPENFLGASNVADIIKVISILVSLWLWGLALWFFLVTATSVMGKVFDNNGLHIFASVMTVAIIIVWIIIFARMCWSLKMKKLLWPRDEK